MQRRTPSLTSPSIDPPFPHRLAISPEHRKSLFTLELYRKKETLEDIRRILNQIFDLHVDEWVETGRIAEGSRFRVTYKKNILHFYLAHAFAHPQLEDYQYAGVHEFPGLITRVDTEAQLQHAYKDRPWSSVDRRRHASEFCDALLAAGNGDARLEAMHGLWELAVRKDHHEGYHVFTNARVGRVVKFVVPEKVSNVQSRDDDADKLTTVFEARW